MWASLREGQARPKIRVPVQLQKGERQGRCRLPALVQSLPHLCQRTVLPQAGLAWLAH